MATFLFQRTPRHPQLAVIVLTFSPSAAVSYAFGAASGLIGAPSAFTMVAAVALISIITARTADKTFFVTLISINTGPFFDPTLEIGNKLLSSRTLQK